MNRREFMMLGTAGAVMGGRMASCAAEGAANRPPIVKRDAPPRNRRPYSGLDWSKVVRIKTTTHGHCMNQRALDVYLKRGFGLLTLSNYYPSAPWWPLSKMTRNYWRLHHDHPVMVDGKRVDGPFDWNKIVAQWKDTLDPQATAKK